MLRAGVDERGQSQLANPSQPLERPAVDSAAPAFALRLALGEMADMLLSGQRVVPKRLLELGYRFRFPDLEGALKDLLG